MGLAMFKAKYGYEVSRIISNSVYTNEIKLELIMDVLGQIDTEVSLLKEDSKNTIKAMDEELIKLNIELCKLNYAEGCKNVHREDKEGTPVRNADTGTC